jgi:hypothetical protein
VFVAPQATGTSEKMETSRRNGGRMRQAFTEFSGAWWIMVAWSLSKTGAEARRFLDESGCAHIGNLKDITGTIILQIQVANRLPGGAFMLSGATQLRNDKPVRVAARRFLAGTRNP